MINLTQISETFGDCTARYSVEMDKQYTVKEFINDVLKRNEWGYIGILDMGDSIFGNPYCEYKKNKLLSELPNEILDKVIIDATASGGWSRMDYMLNID